MKRLLPIAALLLVGCGARRPAFDYVTQLGGESRTILAGVYSLVGKAQGVVPNDCKLEIRQDGTFSIRNIPPLSASTAPVYWFDELTNATGHWQVSRLGRVGEKAVWGISFDMPGKIYCVFCFFGGHAAPYRLAVLQDARKLNSNVALEFQREKL